MKNILTLVICLSGLFSFSQVKLGMHALYSIAPANATSPSVGVPYGSSITLTCFIQNTGNVNYSGPVSIYKRVDSLGPTGPVVFYDSIHVNNFLPGDTLTVLVHDTVLPALYRQAGNGNTIVVWPYVSGGQTTDSLFAGPVYVTGDVGIREIEEEYLSVFPNPASHTLNIKPKPGISYEKISIYDVQSKKIAELNFTEEVDVSRLAPGTYWISVSTRNGGRFKARFMKTE
jgi:hypothetical protein